MSIASDSCASASESGTGDDLMIAAATSGCGIARRLRALGVAEVDPAGLEKNLDEGVSERYTQRSLRYVHPHTLRDTGEPAEEAAPAHLLLA